MKLKNTIKKFMWFGLTLLMILALPLRVSAETKAIDGKSYTRVASGSIRTSGETTEIVYYRIRYTEYVDNTGNYISTIDNVYIHGGTVSNVTYVSDNGYPKYTGEGTKNATISCKGQLQYNKYLPYGFNVNFKININVNDGSRV